MKNLKKHYMKTHNLSRVLMSLEIDTVFHCIYQKRGILPGDPVPFFSLHFHSLHCSQNVLQGKTQYTLTYEHIILILTTSYMILHNESVMTQPHLPQKKNKFHPAFLETPSIRNHNTHMLKIQKSENTLKLYKFGITPEPSSSAPFRLRDNSCNEVGLGLTCK